MTSSARPLTDLDFCSGSRIEELNKLLEELERRERSTLQGKDILQTCVEAKDYVFSLIEHVYPLPSPNTFLVLSGGLCSGVLDVSPYDLGSTTPLSCPPISYTLLVPILRLPSPDLLHQTSPCHCFLPLSLWDPPHPHLHPNTPHVSPANVALWFSTCLLSATSNQSTPSPLFSVEGAEPWGNCVSLLLSNPTGLLLRFDVVPVVEVQGWPPGAHYLEEWLEQEGGPPKLFHLLPWGSDGQWRVGFPGVELFMRRCLHPALSRVLRAAMAVLGNSLQKTRSPGPYIIWVILIHACERLPKGYLYREQNSALCFLGLLEELSLSFLRGSCPNPFIPGCDLLSGGLAGPYLARRVSEVRAEPVMYLREVVREAKEAFKGEKEEKDEREDKDEREERGSSCYPS